MISSIYDFQVQAIDGSTVSMSLFQNKVILIVNVASRCGFTPQYEELEVLYQQYRENGFVVLAFPCNQFLKQEPGSAEEIKEFCSLNYKITFPIMAKINVNGPQTAPLYQFIKAQKPGFLGIQAIKWNFTKFLIGRDGQVIRRYSPLIKPDKIELDIIKALAASGAWMK